MHKERIQAILSTSGVARGHLEALELRDGDKQRYNGRGVPKALENMNTLLCPIIMGLDSRNLSFQEFMVILIRFKRFRAALRCGAELYHALRALEAKVSEAERLCLIPT